MISAEISIQQSCNSRILPGCQAISWKEERMHDRELHRHALLSEVMSIASKAHLTPQRLCTRFRLRKVICRPSEGCALGQALMSRHLLHELCPAQSLSTQRCCLDSPDLYPLLLRPLLNGVCIGFLTGALCRLVLQQLRLKTKSQRHAPHQEMAPFAGVREWHVLKRALLYRLALGITS